MGRADLQQSLEHIMSQICQDKFGGRDAPVVTLSEGTGVGVDGRLHGSLIVEIGRRDGSMARLHEQPLDGIDSEAGLKDAFAQTLSTVLAKHTSWPR